MSNQNTTMVTKETVERKWYILDAAGKPMGKTAALAADLLRGKLKTVRIGTFLAKSGVTSFAPASMTLPYDTLANAFAAGARLKREQPAGCSRIVGINMEGPFFSEKKKGAQNAEYLRNPDFEAFKALYEGCGGLIRLVDLAPELPGAVAFTEKAKELCTVSIAHTDATYEEAKAVIDAGATHLTHSASV